METIIVEIVIGASGETVDFALPAHVPLSGMLSDIIRLIEQTHPALLIDKASPMLCDVTNGRMLHPNLTLAQSGVSPGHRLLIA